MGQWRAILLVGFVGWVGACTLTATIGRQDAEQSGESTAEGASITVAAETESSWPMTGDATPGDATSDNDDRGHDHSASSTEPLETTPTTSETSDDTSTGAEESEDTRGEPHRCADSASPQTCAGCMNAECCDEIVACKSDPVCECHRSCIGAFPGSDCASECPPLDSSNHLPYTRFIECGMQSCRFECTPSP